jgi:ferricrocin synthase
MELIDDTLVWRTACKVEITKSSLAKDILERLETALRETVYFPDAATIDFTEHDASICNLPGFPRNLENPLSSPTSERQPHRSLKEWSAQELAIRAVLSKVSRVPEDEISKDMSIFHLGLDSISAIKVSSLLGKQSINLSVSELLRAATVDKMAHLLKADLIRREPFTQKSMSFLEERIGEIDVRLLLRDVSIDEGCIESHMPASAGQVYMLSAWQNSRGTIFYPCFFYDIESVLDRKRLNEAWSKLHQFSPILRTTFLATGQRDLPFIQAIFRQVQNPVIWLSNGEKISAGQPPSFKLPPVTLYARYAPHRTLLQLEIHHALYDGVSLPLLMKQLQGLYGYPNLQPDTVSNYREFLSLNCLTPEQHRKQKGFWENYLGSSLSLIPPERLASTDKRVEVFTPGVQDTLATLEPLARSRGLSLQVVFLAAYSKVHAKLLYRTDSTEGGDVAFGIYLANRGLPVEGILDLTAPTLNLVPLRVVEPLKTSITDIARMIQADLQNISSIQNSGVGLWEIENWTGLKFNCFLNFLKLPDSTESNPTPNRDNKIPLELVPLERRSPRRQVVETRKEGFVEPKALKSNAVKDAYLVSSLFTLKKTISLYLINNSKKQPSLDIEATIRDGHLDIGAFCPEELLSLENVEKLIHDIREILERYVVQEGKGCPRGIS